MNADEARKIMNDNRPRRIKDQVAFIKRDIEKRAKDSYDFVELQHLDHIFQETWDVLKSEGYGICKHDGWVTIKW